MSTGRRTGQGLGFLARDAEDRAVYVISVAADLAGMHPQTLRQYDRVGLVSPARTSGRGRRYSHRDVIRLRRVQALSQEGINLEGIRRILELEEQVEDLERANYLLQLRQAAVERVFAAAADGEVQVVPRRERPRPARNPTAHPADPMARRPDPMAHPADPMAHRPDPMAHLADEHDS